jgi:hypothetical protein
MRNHGARFPNLGLANEPRPVSLWTLDTPPTLGGGVESNRLTESFRAAMLKPFPKSII